jgi:hypothetical protein
MTRNNILNTIFKQLQYACVLQLGVSENEDIVSLKEKHWECVDDVKNVESDFDEKYPTIFHFSLIGKQYTQDILDYISISYSRDGWQKRFILLEFEDINEEQEKQLKEFSYSKIEKNYFIHELYKHYLYRK